MDGSELDNGEKFSNEEQEENVKNLEILTKINDNANGQQVEVIDYYQSPPKRIKIPPDNPQYNKSESRLTLIFPQDEDITINLNQLTKGNKDLPLSQGVPEFDIHIPQIHQKSSKDSKLPEAGLWVYQRYDINGSYAFGRIHDNVEGNRIVLTDIGGRPVYYKNKNGEYEEIGVNAEFNSLHWGRMSNLYNEDYMESRRNTTMLSSIFAGIGLGIQELTSGNVKYPQNNPIYIYDRNINWYIDDWYGGKFFPEDPDTRYRDFRVFEYKYMMQPNLFSRCWKSNMGDRPSDGESGVFYCDMNFEIDKIKEENTERPIKCKGITKQNKKKTAWDCLTYKDCVRRRNGDTDRIYKPKGPKPDYWAKKYKNHPYWNLALICQLEPIDFAYETSEKPFLEAGVNFCSFDTIKFKTQPPPVGTILDVIKVSHDIFSCPVGGDCFERQPGGSIVTLRESGVKELDNGDLVYSHGRTGLAGGRYSKLYFMQNPTNPLMKENRNKNYKEFYKDDNNGKNYEVCHTGFSQLRSYCSYPQERNLQKISWIKDVKCL